MLTADKRPMPTWPDFKNLAATLVSENRVLDAGPIILRILGSGPMGAEWKIRTLLLYLMRSCQLHQASQLAAVLDEYLPVTGRYCWDLVTLGEYIMHSRQGCQAGMDRAVRRWAYLQKNGTCSPGFMLSYVSNPASCLTIPVPPPVQKRRRPRRSCILGPRKDTIYQVQRYAKHLVRADHLLDAVPQLMRWNEGRTKPAKLRWFFSSLFLHARDFQAGQAIGLFDEYYPKIKQAVRQDLTTRLLGMLVRLKDEGRYLQCFRRVHDLRAKGLVAPGFSIIPYTLEGQRWIAGRQARFRLRNQQGSEDGWEAEMERGRAWSGYGTTGYF